jgi:hypothetical protein
MYSNTLEPPRLQRERLAAYLIAQQSSSATFFVITLSFPQGKFERQFKKCYYLVFVLI